MSVTVTVALAVFASAVSGVPLMTPVPVSMPSPDGRPVAPYSAMSVSVVLGVMALTATPTCSDKGAVYVAEGAVRSTARARVTSLGGVYPVLLALTVTATLAPVR